MQKILVYTMKNCPYCESAKRLLKQKGFAFEEKLLDLSDDAAWKELEERTHHKTMPQIFIGQKFIGGYSELAALNEKGELEHMVK